MIDTNNTNEIDIDDIDLDEQEQCSDSSENLELYEHIRLTVDEGQNPIRVDKFMIEKLPNSSRNRIQKAAEAGFVHVNGKAVKSNHKVRPLDVITLMLDRPRHDTTIKPEEIALDIVFEDSQVMVVNKPAGLVVHPGVGNYHGTLINAVAWHLRDDKNFDPNSSEVGLVHRIDKDTSGLLVIAKTPEAKANLSLQFFKKTTKRSYLALVWGHIQEESGTIEGNITRDPKDRQRMTVAPAGSDLGKHAITHFKVLERFGYTTLIECILETGRTHQIRAHMKHIGHPLFGDERYGGKEILRGNRSASYKSFIQNCFALCNRQALHAQTLGFVHPTTKEECLFSVALPSDMEQMLNKWRVYINGTNNDVMESAK